MLQFAPVAAADLRRRQWPRPHGRATGDPAPGGGTISHFGLWPAVDAAGAVGFVASVDGGPSPVAILAGGSGPLEVSRPSATRCPAAGRIATFTSVPRRRVEPDGTLTFVVAPTATGEGAEGLFVAAPSR